VGSIVRRYGAAWLRRYPQTPLGVQQVLARLAACRTPALGGHVSACTYCGTVRYRYHSCGDRHCPACGGHKRAQWLEQRRAELLPVPYFHVVFTLPHQLSALVLGNRRQLYPLLMRSAAQTLLEVAANPRQLGARLGVLLVLHTWGQQLEHHPHVHAVVPGGGLSLARAAEGSGAADARWIASRPNFLLPVTVLAQVFRGKYLQALRQAYVAGTLRLAGSTAALADAAVFETWLTELYRLPWVVYAKEPFGNDPEQVLKYLARYTNRVAFSNARLLRLAQDQVTFTYKDYADGHQRKELTLPAVEFLRRFALHVVPGGLVRVRQYGWLANRDRQKHLARCRELLGAAAAPQSTAPAASAEPRRPMLGSSWLAVLLPLLFAGLPPLPPPSAAALDQPSAAPRCLDCGVGRLETLWQQPRVRNRELPELSWWQRRACREEIFDSS
jgi:hypothetical protein